MNERKNELGDHRHKDAPDERQSLPRGSLAYALQFQTLPNVTAPLGPLSPAPPLYPIPIQFALGSHKNKEGRWGEAQSSLGLEIVFSRERSLSERDAGRPYHENIENYFLQLL